MPSGVELSAEAVDVVSLECAALWQRTRRRREGLHAWLIRVAGEALERGVRRTGGDKIEYLGLRFVFEESGVWPVLKTIMPGRQASEAAEVVDAGAL